MPAFKAISRWSGIISVNQGDKTGTGRGTFRGQEEELGVGSAEPRVKSTGSGASIAYRLSDFPTYGRPVLLNQLN